MTSDSSIASPRQEFDPYYKWLGIPVQEQPPHHYRLLGIELFEPDPDVIDAAVNRQMGYIKQCATGPHVAASQRLLNELSTARLCLSTPGKKAAYDRQLQSQFDEEDKPEFQDARQREGRRRRQTLVPPVMILMIAAALGGGAAYGLFKLFPQFSANVEFEDSKKQQVGRKKTAPDNSSNPKPASQDVAKTRPAPIPVPNPVATPAQTPAMTRRPQRLKPEQINRAVVAPIPAESQLATASEPIPKPAVAKNDEAREPTQPADENLPVEGPQEAVTEQDEIRQPVPSNPEQKAAERSIKQRLRDRFKVRGRFQRSALVADLRSQAGKAEESAERFAYFSLARSTAAGIGEFETALEIVDDVFEQYEIDSWQLKLESLSKAVANLPTRNAAKEFAQVTLRLIDESVAVNDFSTASRLSSLAFRGVKRSGDGVLQRTVETRRKEITKLRKEYDRVKSVEKKLNVSPDDPVLNLKWGSYLCFTRQDWENGLPFLANGGDEKLKAAAIADVDQPTDATAQAKVGDRWWKVAGSLRGAKRDSATFRARVWYVQAVEELAGLAKARLEQRIQQVDEIERRKFKNKPAEVEVAFKRSSVLSRLSRSWADVPDLIVPPRSV